MFFIIKNTCFFICALTQKGSNNKHSFFEFKKFKRQSTPIKPIRAEAASVNAHGGTRTRNLTVCNRARYRCATWTCVVLLNKN